MARHVWSVLCTRGILDRGTELLSMIDVIEELRAFTSDTRIPDPSENVGLATPHLTLVSTGLRSARKQAEAASMSLSIQTPYKRDVPLINDVKIDLESGWRCRLILSISVIPLHGPGSYELCVHLNSPGEASAPVAKIPFDLRFFNSLADAYYAE